MKSKFLFSTFSVVLLCSVSVQALDESGYTCSDNVHGTIQVCEADLTDCRAHMHHACFEWDDCAVAKNEVVPFNINKYLYARTDSFCSDKKNV